MRPKAAAILSAIGIGASLAACSGVPSSIQAAGANSTSIDTEGRVMVSCGEDRRALVRQVSMGGETVAQVECVGTGLSAGYAPPAAALPQIVPAVREVRTVPEVVYSSQGPVVTEAVVTEPVVRQRVVNREDYRYESRRRSAKKSAVIIGGTTAGGAGVGAIIDGKKGAAIGAGVGLAGGAIYDLLTRDKR